MKHKNSTNSSKYSGIGGKWDGECHHVQDLEKLELSGLGTDRFAFALGPSTQGQIGYFLWFLSSYWIYVYNIFTKNYRWQIIISCNLNSPLNLLFFPP